MNVLQMVGLVVGVLVFVLLVVALYYFIRFLLKPRLHIKSYDMQVSQDEKRGFPDNYLPSTFVMLDFERETGADVGSVARDFRFQLSAVYSYQDVMRFIADHCSNSGSDSKNLSKAIRSFSEHISCLTYVIDDCLNKILKESERSPLSVVPRDVYDKMLSNYRQLYIIGGKIKDYAATAFNSVYDYETLRFCGLAVEVIRTECERKLFIFDHDSMLPYVPVGITK